MLNNNLLGYSEANLNGIQSKVYVSDGLIIVPSESYTNVSYSNNNINDWSDLLKSDVGELVFVKYLPFSLLKRSIENKYFYFASPQQWEDTFEHLLPMNIKIGNEEKAIRCSCFGVTDFGNEEGFWKLFKSKKRDKIVAVTFNVKKLFSALSVIENDQIVFYLKGVSYVKRHDILVALKSHSDKATLEETLDLMSKKRFAFGHEQELRLFALIPKDNNGEVNNKVFCDYSADVIESITMPPMPPINKKDKRYNHYKMMQDCYNIELEEDIKELIQNHKLGSCRILQSALYITDDILDPKKYFVGEENGRNE